MAGCLPGSNGAAPSGQEVLESASHLGMPAESATAEDVSTSASEPSPSPISESPRGTGVRSFSALGLNGSVRAVLTQQDGKLLLGGDFSASSLEGVVTSRLLRLNADFSVDQGFQQRLGTGFDGSVRVLALQSDGKILVGGDFGNVDGRRVPHLARLKPEGNLDIDFVEALEGGFDDRVSAITIQKDGDILVGGNFVRFAGKPVQRMVRLKPAGFLDENYGSISVQMSVLEASATPQAGTQERDAPVSASPEPVMMPGATPIPAPSAVSSPIPSPAPTVGASVPVDGEKDKKDKKDKDHDDNRDKDKHDNANDKK